VDAREAGTGRRDRAVAKKHLSSKDIESVRRREHNARRQAGLTPGLAGGIMKSV
jgi:hypothetical protein